MTISGAPGEVTRELKAARAGDAAAQERLWNLVHDQLRAIAANLMQREQAGHVLQPTAVVNEAFLRLFGDRMPEVANRRHFLAVAASAMRRVLVEHARRRDSAKRGGGWHRVTLADRPVDAGIDVDVVALHEALERLGDLGERLARIVELRYFGGLTISETAEELGVSPATVKEDWALARTWLYRELHGAA